MHPIERLRFVARAEHAPPDDLVQEAVGSLAGFSADPVALVTACRRLLDRHPANGPLWWLCASVLQAADPADEVWRCADRLHADGTSKALSRGLPDEAAAVLVGRSDRIGASLVPRGDVQAWIVDLDGEGWGLVRDLERLDVDATDIPLAGLASAVAAADVVLLDAQLIGPDRAICGRGSWQAAAVARTSGVPVWLVGGVGRSVGPRLWPAVLDRLGGASDSPWEGRHDLVPLDLVDQVVDAEGPRPVARALATVDVPDAPELRR